MALCPPARAPVCLGGASRLLRAASLCVGESRAKKAKMPEVRGGGQTLSPGKQRPVTAQRGGGGAAASASAAATGESFFVVFFFLIAGASLRGDRTKKGFVWPPRRIPADIHKQLWES